MKKSISSPEFKVVARYLRQLRLDAGWSQSEVARKLRRNQTFVSSIELAFRRLDPVELRDYLAIFGVTLREWGAAMDAAFASVPPTRPKRPTRKKKTGRV